MKKTQKINLQEYTVVITYDDVKGSLDVTVLDELDDVIEVISITNDEESDEPKIDPTLN